MTTFAHPTKPAKSKHTAIGYGALGLACLLVVTVVTQLFKFEDFVALFVSFGIVSSAQATALASVLVSAEVFALPFLLRMYLSPLMRALSMALGWLVAAIWLYVMTVLGVSGAMPSDTGVLGTAIEVPYGWWSVGFALVLVGLAAWISWGQWPSLDAARRTTK